MSAKNGMNQTPGPSDDEQVVTRPLTRPVWRETAPRTPSGEQTRGYVFLVAVEAKTGTPVDFIEMDLWDALDHWKESDPDIIRAPACLVDHLLPGENWGGYVIEPAFHALMNRVGGGILAWDTEWDAEEEDQADDQAADGEPRNITNPTPGGHAR